MIRGAGRGFFAGTVFIGSFLLFLIQPMTARMALPLLGGSPNVWNSAMLVYQLLLLGGYAYAHWLSRFAVSRQAGIHLILMVVAALTLPIALPEMAAPAPGWEFLWVPWLFMLTVGSAFFVVSAQAPLMQRWFASHHGAGDPYPLYAASNLGSFTGLLAYPLLAEPLLTVTEQSLAWAAGFALLVLLVLLAAQSRWGAVQSGQQEEEREKWRPGWRKAGLWLVLSAVPSGLMLSTTTYLTTDIMALPLLWVIPLGLYLLSFTVAFAERRKGANLIKVIAPLAIFVSIFATFGLGPNSGMLAAASCLVMLFTGSVALHARLYESRPDPRNLTGFYLVMSAGGALGGAFTALAAPLIFDWTWEHPILIFALVVLLPMDGTRDLLARLAIRTVALRLALVLGGLVLLAMSSLKDRLFSAAEDQRLRSYFGVYSIRSSAEEVRILIHGTTTHGAQRGSSTEPTSYYGRSSGAGLALKKAPELFGERARVGVVGLGAGTLACYRKPGQAWTFYEIDPAVVTYSENGTFTFLSECAPDAPIIIGDARLKLAEAPRESLEVLVVDAFSSDAIPIHLVTSDAVRVYRDVLTPGGLLLVHISNRHIDLAPVFSALVREQGLAAAIRHDPGDPDKYLTQSAWIAISADSDVLARLTDDGRWEELPEAKGRAWSDDFASILPYINWGK